LSRNRGLILCLLGIGALSILSALAYRLPPPRSDAAPDAFSAYRAQAELKSLVGDGVPHPIGSEANARVRAAIVQRLSALGYETQIQSGFVCNMYAICGKPSNIIARLPARQQSGGGSGDDADWVLLAAHYDSVPAGPGASDDAAGVATVLEIARILAGKPQTRHPIALLISDGEEPGLLGALLFIRDHPLAKSVAAAVNLDARGSSGPSLMFETGSANSWLMRLYRGAIAHPITDSVYYAAYKTLHNDTDFTVFKSAGLQGFNFAFIGDVGHYHTALDTFANADLRSIQHQGDNALASLLALADSGALRSEPAGDAVYFDVFARTLIAWPARDSLVAASIILALLLIEATLLCRYRRVSVRQIAWGCLGAFTCMVLAGVASGIILLLLRKSGKLPPFGQYSWIAHHAWMNMVCAALAAAAAGLSSHWFARRAGFWGFWLGAVLLLAFGAELLAGLRPGMGFLSLLTAGIAVIAVIPCLRANPFSGAASSSGTASSWSPDIAALTPAWMLFALLIPLLSLLYGAIGSVAWLIDTALFGMGATLLLPLLAAASATLRRRIIAVAVTASFLGVVITFLLPTYSAASPQRVNFEYQLDADKHEAVWAAEPDSLKLPAAVAAAAGFDAKPQLRFLGGWTQAFYAPAPWKELKPPLLTLRGVQAQPAGITRYSVHLQSMRGAPEVEVSFPGAARIREIILDDGSAERRMPLFDAKNGETRLHVVGLAPSGMDFAVDVRGSSLQAHLFDQSYALPGGEFLQRLRSREATSSQDGDTTIVQDTVMLDPAAGG
jgi:hypothetical protein